MKMPKKNNEQNRNHGKQKSAPPSELLGVAIYKYTRSQSISDAWTLVNGQSWTTTYCNGGFNVTAISVRIYPTHILHQLDLLD